MNISKKGIAKLRHLEGSERTVYKDSAGLPTIGVGHLLTKDEIRSGKINISGKIIDYKDGLSISEIDLLLGQDLVSREVCVEKMVRVPLSQNQFDALVIFVFNIGRKAFMDSTLLKQLNQGNYNGVPDQLRRWVYAAGERIKGLVSRREAEIEVWNNSGFAEERRASDGIEKKTAQTLSSLISNNNLSLYAKDETTGKDLTICYNQSSQKFEIK